MNADLEKIVDSVLANGVLTDRSRELLMKKAEQLGVDLIDFELELESKIAQKKASTNSPLPIYSSSNLSNKEGVLKKCPGCGASVESFKTNCPECGHEFRGYDKPIQDLVNELNALQYPVKKGLLDLSYNNNVYAVGMKRAEIITNYPINNYKEDILEFLGMVLQHTKSSGGMQGFLGSLQANLDAGKSQEINAWKQKAQQVIMKARMSMKDDKKTLEEIENYAKQLGIK
jgi:hypothetical protein